MNSLLKDRIRTAQGQSKDCVHMLSLAEEKVSSQERLIESLQQVNNTRQKEKLEKYSNNKNLIAEHQQAKVFKENELSELESQIKDVTSHKELLTSLRQSQSDINSELKLLPKN